MGKQFKHDFINVHIDQLLKFYMCVYVHVFNVCFFPRMNPYACLSMGDQVGLIEVVLDSTTIAKIQKQQSGARGAFDKKLLYSWLKNKNKSQAE